MRGGRSPWSRMALLLGVAGCGRGGNWLEGSLVDVYAVTFETTRVRLYDSELAVEYVEGPDAGEAVSLRVAIDVPAMPFAAGVAYSLAGHGHVGRGDDFGAGLPALTEGDFVLEEWSGRDGEPATGTFDAAFVSDEGSALSVRGAFSAPLEVVAVWGR